MVIRYVFFGFSLTVVVCVPIPTKTLNTEPYLTIYFSVGAQADESFRGDGFCELFAVSIHSHGGSSLDALSENVSNPFTHKEVRSQISLTHWVL